MDFSVSMCVYNGDRADWFKEAVDSLLNQTVLPKEIVLVVDGPISGEIAEAVDEFEKKPIFKVIRLEKNTGHGNARRVGLENCSYDYVAIMDADDINLPYRFEKEIALFRSDSSLDIVGGNIAEFIGEENNIVGERLVPDTDSGIKEYMRKRCPMNQITVLFKKMSVMEAGGYIDWFCEEDYYLWIRMALKNMKFANVPEILVHVRVGKDMYRRRGGIKYFRSEKKLQKYMRQNKIIGLGTYMANVSKRFIVQVLMPNRIRGWTFKRFARRSANGQKI